MIMRARCRKDLLGEGLGFLSVWFGVCSMLVLYKKSEEKLGSSDLTLEVKEVYNLSIAKISSFAYNVFRMAEEQQKTNPLLLVLLAVVSFAGGLFFLAVLVIILVSLGLLSV